MRAIILINTQPRKRTQLLDKIKLLSNIRIIPKIRYAFATTGLFDIIVLTIFEDLKELFNLIREIYKIEDIASTETQIEFPLGYDIYDLSKCEENLKLFIYFKGIRAVSFLKVEKLDLSILKRILDIDGVVDAFYLLGRFDIVVLICANTISDLKNIINKIHWTEGVKKEETMMEI